MCVCVCVRACVCGCGCGCGCVLCVGVNFDSFGPFLLTFPNIFFTFHLTPSYHESLLPPAPTLPPYRRRRRPRENTIGDDGAAALAGAVANLTALEKINLG